MYIVLEKIFNLIDRYHQRRIIKFLKDLNFDYAIDVGAHKGAFISGILILKKVKKIYAFEPQVNIFKVLKNKYANNDNVKIYNLALDKEISKKDIYINKLSSTSTLSKFNPDSIFLKIKIWLLFQKKLHWQIQIQTNTIDNQFKDIKLENTLKIDVEGLELDVLMGAEYKISNEIKYILIEHKYGKQYEGSRKKWFTNFYKVRIL